MSARTHVYLYGESWGFTVSAVFDRVPSPGEHVFLWLTDDQRAQIRGKEYESHPATPGIVRMTALRQVVPGTDDEAADLWVEAVKAQDWMTKQAEVGARAFGPRD